MPNLNHKGPEGNGPKTGRRLGKCRSSEADLQQQHELGVRRRMHRSDDDTCGKGEMRGRKYRNRNNNTQE